MVTYSLDSAGFSKGKVTSIVAVACDGKETRRYYVTATTAERMEPHSPVLVADIPALLSLLNNAASRFEGN